MAKSRKKKKAKKKKKTSKKKKTASRKKKRKRNKIPSSIQDLVHSNKNDENIFFPPLNLYMHPNLAIYMEREAKLEEEDDKENVVTVLRSYGEEYNVERCKIIRLLEWTSFSPGLLGAIMSEIRQYSVPSSQKSLKTLDKKRITRLWKKWFVRELRKS